MGMSTIFISHSSANNGLALALRDWLVREGWHDLFLDIDVERGIVAGSRWLKALTEAGTRAKAVVFLITPEWIQSRYCHAEFFSAVEKGKPIFGLLAAKLHFNDIPVEMRDAWQLCDLINGSEFEEFTVAGPPSYLPEKVGLSKSGLAQLRRGLL